MIINEPQTQTRTFDAHISIDPDHCASEEVIKSLEYTQTSQGDCVRLKPIFDGLAN